MQKLVVQASVLVVLVGLFAHSTSAGSLKWRHSSAIGDLASDQALQDVADRLKAMTNLSADPCDDFYEFACGGAKLQVEDWGLVSKLTDILDSRLDLMLASSTMNATTGTKLMRNLFDSYEARDRTRDENIASIRDLVRKLGGIPALGERSGWIEGTQIRWTDLAVQLRRLGLQTDLFYNLRVDQNHLNHSQAAIYISLPYVEAIDNDSRKNYKLLAYEYLMPDMTKAEAKRFKDHLDATVRFRLQLSKIFIKYSPKVHSRQNSTKPPPFGFWPNNKLDAEDYQLMSIKSLELLVPQLDWAGFLSELFQYPLSSEVEIFLYKPKAFVKVQKLIESQSSPDVLRNFMMLEAIDDFTKHSMALDSGAELIKTELGLALTAEYVRNFLLPETRASATIMVDYLRRELKTMIGEADWISDMAKQGALAKADSMISYVGYPDELLDDTKIAEFYSGLELDPKNFIASMLNINSWKARAESEMLKHSSASWQVFEYGWNINAFYYPEYNSINILPTMMQDFLYNSHQPYYVNFAALGFIVGHEISHAFDSNCIKYDCHGDEQCWWDPKTGAEYQQRSNCFEHQYDESQVFGDYSWLDGSYTLGENIADNIGAKIARRAYTTWLADQPAGYEEPLLGDSLAKFNQDQLYWTSLAQFWCFREQPINEEDVHSPHKLRVDITLSNQAEFAEAFQCRIGSRMNPEDRCTMW